MSGRPAEIALGLTDPRDAERLLADDPLLREEVARMRATASLLGRLDASEWHPEPPPPLASAPAAPRTRPRRRLRLAVLSAAAAAVVAIVVLLGVRSPSSRTIALHPVGRVSGAATLTLAGDEAELRGSGMRPSGRHDYYEAWLGDRHGRMVPMGTFRVDRHGHVDARMTIAVDLADYDSVDVSLEPDDGNPAHSATSVMRARL